jgi:uncharacterized membrane protein YedE/YeeE
MKQLKFIVVGVIFGIIMAKSEAISWYRIQEMFRFQSFHMYGIIGTAVVLGAMGVLLIKKFKLKNINGQTIVIPQKPKNYKAAIFGGTIFGMGWAMTGACPGPLFVSFGYGYSAFLIPIVAAIFGAFVHGLIDHKLPK